MSFYTFSTKNRIYLEQLKFGVFSIQENYVTKTSIYPIGNDDFFFWSCQPVLFYMIPQNLEGTYHELRFIVETNYILIAHNLFSFELNNNNGFEF